MADLPESITASQQYLTDFSRIVNEGGSVEDVVNAMLKLHGDRDNPRTLWHSARTAVAKRVSHIPQSCPRGGQTSRESADSPGRKTSSRPRRAFSQPFVALTSGARGPTAATGRRSWARIRTSFGHYLVDLGDQ